MPQQPFQLTPPQQQQLDAVLNAWEQESGKVKTLTAKFTRFKYDPVFGNAEEPQRTPGEISYAAPDRGHFRVFGEGGDHWVCDGKSVFQYDYEKKELLEFPLPPELYGQSIVDGPLPFLFGANAAKIKERYFIRVNYVEKKQIQLEAYPRRASDAANYARVDVRLNREGMLPSAIQLWDPGGQIRNVYVFDKPQVNNVFDQIKNKLATPTKPFGWTRIVRPLEPAPPADRGPQVGRQPQQPGAAAQPRR